MSTNPITGLFLTTTPIVYPNNDHATGFFFRFEDTTYLVTNRHALDFRTENDDPLRTAKICIRNDPDDLDKFDEKDLELLDNQGERQWINNDERVDIALVPLEPPFLDETIDILPPRAVNEADEYPYGNIAFRQEHFPESSPNSMTVSGGSGAIILGYPLYVFDSSYPIARNASISSPYGRTVEELVESAAGIPKSAFLTDALGHPGLSGSPVISTPLGAISQNPDTPENVFKAATLMQYNTKMSLLGVHAGEFNLLSELQLNNATYPYAIINMLDT